MAIRIRKTGAIVCAAIHPALEGDIYIDDGVHYHLSVIAKVLVTDDDHLQHGCWWWVNDVPDNVEVREI